MAPEDDDDEDLLDDEFDDDEEGDDADFQPDTGIFAERQTVFSSKDVPAERVDHRNPVITREQEAAQMYAIRDGDSDDAPKIARKADSDGSKPTPPQPGEKLPVKAAGGRQLVCRIDSVGRPECAYFVNGQQVEAFRVPTRDEISRLNDEKQRKFVRGGLAAVDETATAAAPMTIAGMPVKKVLIGVAVVGVVAGVGYWVYKKNKADEDTSVDEADG